VAVAAITLKCHISSHDPILLDRVRFAACEADRPSRPLHLQALLQLPRVADTEGFAPVSTVESLLAELAHELPAKTEWFVRDAGSSPRLLIFHGLEAAIARRVSGCFHYLRSPRIDSRAYGLSTRSGHLVALCVTSPLDVVGLEALLEARGRFSKSARVVSRVFVFEGAPKNSISYMLSRAADEERQFGVTDFVTYVNPNMGFTGSSYRASGWQLLGSEPGTKYRYFEDRYTTDRELAARFGEHDDETFRRLLGSRFAVNVMPMAPLLVFHTCLLR